MDDLRRDQALDRMVSRTPLRRIPTPQGYVFHGIKADDAGFVGFGEAYFSQVLPGSIKGWKRHTRMTLNLVAAIGCVKVVVRADATCSVAHRLSPETDQEYARLTIPPGLWVAFEGLSAYPSLLLNIASIPHDAAEVESLPLAAFAFGSDHQATV